MVPSKVVIVPEERKPTKKPTKKPAIPTFSDDNATQTHVENDDTMQKIEEVN